MRTYTPRGQTPVLRVPLTRDHKSVISALTAEGRVLVRMQRSAYRSVAVVQFLKHLLQHVPGQILVIWDGAPIHRSKVIKCGDQTMVSPIVKTLKARGLREIPLLSHDTRRLVFDNRALDAPAHGCKTPGSG